MDEMIDKFDLVIFGVRMASKHLHKRSEYMRCDVDFASKEMFESSTNTVKYCVVMRKLLFNKNWIEETTALDVLKYSLYVMHIIYSRDMRQSSDFYDFVCSNATSLLHEEPEYYEFKHIGFENDYAIREAREYSERMIGLFSVDEISSSVGVGIV